jgi:nucleoside-diphosphate-sugar epimerase
VERSFCYLADAVIGFFTVLLKGHVNEAYNVANPNQTITIKNLALLLVNLFPEKKLSISLLKQKDNYLQSPILSPIADISKITALGWEPTTTIENGFKKTIMSYLNYNLGKNSYYFSKKN